MNVRIFLRKCRDAVFEIRSLERQREAVRIPIGPSNRTASIVCNMGKDNDPTTTALNQYDYYDNMLSEKIADQKEKLVRLEHELALLETERRRTIMRYYYALGWTIAEIAEELKLSDRLVKDEKSAAIKLIERRLPLGI